MEIKVSENLIMRSRTLADAREIFELVDNNREHLRKWLLWVDDTKSAERVENSIKNSRRKDERNDGAILAVVYEGRFIGTVGLKNIDRVNDCAEVGYWLGEEWTGRGIMTSCVRSLTDYCFTELGLNSVYISIADANQKSRAVPERLGFTLEGVLRERKKLHGVYYDEVIYGMTKKKWEYKV